MAGQVAFLLDLGILTIAALVFSIVFAKLRLSIISGQILAGVLVGPSVFGFVKDVTVLSEVSTIGIVLLLFVIGLELDPVELRKLLAKVTSLTLLEVIITFLFAFLAAFVLRLNIVDSVIFSMAVSLTSTAIVAKTFLDRRTIQTKQSGFIIGLLVVEDIIAVLFLVVLSSIGSSGPSRILGLMAILETIIGGFALIGAAYGVARYIAPVLINYLSAFETEFEEIPFLFALGLGFLFGVFGAYFGYSPGIGAFIIGLSIRGKHSKFLSKKIAPVKDLFLILFFVSMGSLINPLPALGIGIIIIIAMALIIAGKFIGGAVVAKLITNSFKDEKNSGLTLKSMGAWLMPRGEFSFVIGQFGLSLGLLDEKLFSIIGLTVLITIILASILQRLFEPRVAESVYPIKGKRDEP